MNITNAGDANPFTFGFQATGSPNIVAYNWNYGDSDTGSGASPGTKTYGATGTYNITLVCDISGGGNLTLDGVITVADVVAAGFYFPNGNEYTGVPPFTTVQTVNTSTGTELDYAWRISGSSVPTDPGIYDFNTQNINRTLTAADFVAAGFEATGPAIIWYHLTATDPNTDLSATASRSVSFTPDAPLYTFDFSPTEVEVDGNVTFEAVDLGGGPVNTNLATAFVWTFTGGSPASATGPGPHTITYDTLDTHRDPDLYGPGGGGSVSKSVNVYAPIPPFRRRQLCILIWPSRRD